MERRRFLVTSAAAISAAAAAPLLPTPMLRLAGAGAPPAPPADLSDWAAVRALFDLDPGYSHFAGFFLVSHPRPVREAIERYRAELDRNPFLTVHGDLDAPNGRSREDDVRRALGTYLGVDGEKEIALTDSTTMGTGLICAGFRLKPGDEVLRTTHDHYVSNCALRFRSERTGHTVREVELYKDGLEFDPQKAVDALRAAVTPATRLLLVTWVHSCSGVKLPIRAIADMVAQVNQSEGRGPDTRLFLMVDGVHGIGIENTTIPELGCDFFVAGTHKWLYAPRGTGFIWARPEAWERLDPIIPPFGDHERPSTLFTPGGFHSFEHRWAVGDAVRLHLQIGKARIHERLHALNLQIREGLRPMSHIQLHTPMKGENSAGIVCFDVKGKKPKDVVAALAAKKILASESPYDPSCARLAASLFNTPEEIDRAIAAVKALA